MRKFVDIKIQLQRIIKTNPSSIIIADNPSNEIKEPYEDDKCITKRIFGTSNLLLSSCLFKLIRKHL